uniref:Uncharacterized protein n=1 Tax=Strombidium rassoulzadegani TaxID=1082188 RepID=A0A7S3CTP8_9SPIT|mmetsp:Transcript_8507/g.14323  ORF Transcript_8507/g.14323 Transcript_8507/m.14323 type:complete len:183 (+) Transcript_8507:24-572(+)
MPLKKCIIPREYLDNSVPPGFLDDVCLLPTFYQPETEQLKWATHQNIRKSIYFQAFRDIKYCEFKRLSKLKSSYPDATFQLGEVVKAEEAYFDKLIDKLTTREIERGGKLIDVYIMNVNRFKTDEYNEKDAVSMEKALLDVGKYKMKVFHMDDDEFRCNVYPQNMLDFMRHRWYTRRWFRLM